MRQRSAGFLGKDVRQLLEADLEELGSVDIVGEVGTVAPDVLARAMVSR